MPYLSSDVKAAQRRKALTLAIVFGNASALSILTLITRGPLVTTVFLLLFLAAFAHNVARYRRLGRREAAA